jgi:hypothetical protein
VRPCVETKGLSLIGSKDAGDLPLFRSQSWV